MVVGIDFGRKRIGLAALHGDGLVLPFATIVQDSRKASLAAVVRHLAELDCKRVVVGLPLNMDGTAGPAALAARRFAEELRLVTAVPVELHDERLSSIEARARMRESPGRKKRDSHDDAVAACVILSRGSHPERVTGNGSWSRAEAMARRTESISGPSAWPRHRERSII